MSVLLVEANKNGKYEFTKEELQELLDKVEQEAFEQGVSFGQKVQESKEKRVGFYAPAPSKPVRDWDWNEVTCKSTVTDPNTIQIQPTATCKSTCIGTDPMDIN